jgi:hypothetical protein
MRLLYLMLALPLASCGGDDCCKLPLDAANDANDPYVEVARVPVTVNRDVDLLFVIDDSPSMLDKQANLRANFPAFINELNGLEGGLPNVHIGVVTTDLGTQGADDAQPGPSIGSGSGSCAGNGKNGVLQGDGNQQLSGTFINDAKNSDGTRTTNYTGSLASVFSSIASVGASGCGFEQPLQAAKQALDNNPANAGFLRPNAGLVIVVLADEDDCSVAHSTLFGADTATLGPLQSFRCTRFGVTCDQGGTTPDQMNSAGPKGGCRSNDSSPYLTRIADYAAFFTGLKADPNNILVSALVGPSAPVEVELRTPPGGGSALPALAHACTYQGALGTEVADPAVRIEQLARRFARHTVASLCAQDLSVPLVQIARRVRALVGDPCLLEPIASPYDCVVREEIGGTTTTLPACNGGASSTNKPCWHLVSDQEHCAVFPNLRLQVERNEAPAPSTVVIARCLP